MYTIFHTDKHTWKSTDDAIIRIMQDFFKQSIEVARTENGKPYLVNSPFFVSVSHTNERIFVAVGEKNIGLDVENLHRDVQYGYIVRKFKNIEREKIISRDVFFKHWTAKEATVKWLGGTIAKDFNKLTFVDGKMIHGDKQLPLHFSFMQAEDCLICLCKEDDVDAECIAL